MANFIQKFRYEREYNEAEHDYPNVSLIEDTGLVYQATDPCFLTETEAQMLENQAVIEDLARAYSESGSFDGDFYLLKDDAQEMLENMSPDDVNSVLDGLENTSVEPFKANCESATFAFRKEGDSTDITYKIGVDPNAGAKAPAELTDYIEITISGIGGSAVASVDMRNMQSDRYDLHVTVGGL